MKSPFNQHVHTSRQNPYLHTDYLTPVGKEHLKIDESQFLAQKYNVKLKAGSNILLSQLNDLLKR